MNPVLWERTEVSQYQRVLKTFVILQITPAPVWSPLLWNGMVKGCFVFVSLLRFLITLQYGGAPASFSAHIAQAESGLQGPLESRYSHSHSALGNVSLLCPQFISILSQPIPLPGATASAHFQGGLPTSRMSVLSHDLFLFFELNLLCLNLSRVRGESHCWYFFNEILGSFDEI